jgi:hypothetical protein
VVLNTENLIEYLECWKVVDIAGNSTGDLCGVPGLCLEGVVSSCGRV